MKSPTLRELCEQYQNGNRSAGDRIDQKCRGIVVNMVRVKGIPEMDVDDVASDVILFIVVQARKVAQYGWAHVTFIVRTAVRTYWRKREQDALGHLIMEVPHADDNDVPLALAEQDRRRAPPQPVAKTVELSELKWLLESALKNLNENQRQAIQLKVEGLTNKEIANTLKQPLGTVKQWLHNGKAALAEYIQRHNGDDFTEAVMA